MLIIFCSTQAFYANLPNVYKTILLSHSLEAFTLFSALLEHIMHLAQLPLA